MNNILENSFIIHSRNYRESSIILDVLTENNGLISLLGKGLKKKKDFSSLQPFKELKLSFTKKSHLPILTKYEIIKNFDVLRNHYLLHGIYINELIHKFTPQYEPCKSLYILYKQQLEAMLDNIKNIDVLLLDFEILFLKEIGYKITVSDSETGNIGLEKNYYYDYEFGFREVQNKLDFPASITGKNLTLLMKNNLDSINNISNIRLITKNIFQRLSGEGKIKSYELFD